MTILKLLTEKLYRSGDLCFCVIFLFVSQVFKNFAVKWRVCDGNTLGDLQDNYIMYIIIVRKLFATLQTSSWKYSHLQVLKYWQFFVSSV